MSKMKTFRCSIFLWSAACAFTLLSCKKLIEVPPPQDQLETGTVFANDMNARDAILGIYSNMMSTPRTLLNAGASVYVSLSADDLTRVLSFPTEDAFTTNALTSQNVPCGNLYTLAYTSINQANVVRSELAVSTGVSAAARRQLTGEADFVRAILYFYLTNLYDSVPLVTGTDYAANAVKPRSSMTDVYGQVVTDLKEAQNLLSEAYATGGASNDRTRPNLLAATALLARVYLYQKNWQQAEQQATAVIADSSLYQLEDLTNVFRTSSREAIWQLQPVANSRTLEATSFIPPTSSLSRPTYVLTPFLQNAFEAGDQRRTYWTGKKMVLGTNYVYPAKYKATTDTASIKEYSTILRLAEQYLIRAEAAAQQGEITLATADLNTIRKRAGLPPVSGLDRDGLLAAIAHERQVELFAEEGHRWLDLKRTGQVNNVLGIEKPGWRAQAVLYPIPFTELQHNVYLTQNPGY